MRKRLIHGHAVLLWAAAVAAASPMVRGAAAADAGTILEKIGVRQGICVLVGALAARLPVDLARASELTIYVQCAGAEETDAVRRAAEDAGLLGTRIFAAEGVFERLYLADNLVDGLVVMPGAKVPEKEVLRVLRPGAVGLLGAKRLKKPISAGADDWSYIFHGPDNNPQSTDRLARAPYLTQFLTAPKWSPMPQVSVAAGGRVFKAYGHQALDDRNECSGSVHVVIVA